MATILTKRSNTAASVPLAAQLTNSSLGAELAVNTADKRLFTKDGSGNVVELGTSPSTFGLPNGTANGVAYLNGSKVLTTGSALTFDGTTLTNLAATGLAAVFERTNAPAVIGIKYNGAVGGYLGAASAGALTWYNDAGSELMRLTSTGLGIGTSSPAGRLTVKTGTNENLSVLTGGSGDLRLSALNDAASTTVQLSIQGSPLYFRGVGGVINATLDSSGNLGLGVVPSAWGSWTGKGVLQFGNSGAYLHGGGTGWSGGNFMYLGNNGYYNGTNWIYSRTTAAGQYVQVDGEHRWLTAPSGTAGNAISFTQAMTLDASGRLLLGTTSDFGGATLQVVKANSTGLDGNIRVSNNVDTSMMLSTVAANVSGIYSSGAIAFGTGSNTFTERARIDSSGNLLVGCTALPSTGVSGVALREVDGTIGRVEITKTFSGNTDGVPFRYNSTYVGGITYSDTAVAYLTSSDYRLKEDVQPMTGALEKIASLKPCTYRWKADGSNGQGFIAHELQAVCPDAVVGEKDAVNEDGSIKPQGIDTSFLVATLTAAIQEQQAQIAALTARLNALDGTTNA